MERLERNLRRHAEVPGWLGSYAARFIAEFRRIRAINGLKEVAGEFGVHRSRQSEQGDHTVPALDGLRAISIILVLACHLLPLGPKALQLNLTAGPMGMSLFFTLSGYLIVSTLRSVSILEFIVKRVTRILPLAYLYILLVLIVFGLSKQALLSHLS